ncbi:MAG: zinc metalloprotease HtpX [Candidatus Altiarchaeota archaeon]
MLKTTALMSLLIAVVMIAFWFVGGRGFALFGLILGVIINLGVYWHSDKIVLRMTRAREVSRDEAPMLHGIVDRLASRAKMPKPRVYVVENRSLNAFATGRNPKHAAVAVHTGLLQALTPEEVEGVLGHEMTHIKNRDTLISTMAAVIAGILSYLGYAYMFSGDRRDRNNVLALAAIILAPMAGMLIQMAISRTREYAADAGGGRLSNPRCLASALAKISSSADANPVRRGNPATAHMYIINPFKGVEFSSLFSTHPLTEDRIRKLEAM